MKKNFKFLSALLLAVAMVMPAQATNTITVFDGGDEYSTEIPVNLGYIDEVGTRSQVIYPATSLTEMTNEVINSITFYAPSGITISGGKVLVSVGETTDDTFTSGYFTGLTQVATITMVAGTTELVVNFDTPYMYHGGNLIIDTYVEEAAPEYSFDLFVGVRPSNYCAKTVSGVAKFLPKSTFNYGVDADYAAKVLPGELTFNTIRAERQDVQTVVLKNIGTSDFTPTFSVDAPFIVNMPAAALAAGQSLNVPVTFAPAQAGDYTGTLTVDCGAAGSFDVILHATAIEAATDMTVCSGLDYNSFLPMYGVEIDVVGSQGQVIYPESMLADMVGSKIIALQFYARKIQMDGGVIQLSLKTVDEETFAGDVVTPFTGATAVGTASPVKGSTDLSFTFDQPFEYNGGNLLIEAKVIEPGYISADYPQTYFYGVPTDSIDVGLYTWPEYDGSFSSIIVPFWPKVTFSYQENQQVWAVGDVNHDGDVDVSDVTALIAYVLNGTTGVFYTEQADVYDDGTGEIDISDVTSLITLVLSGV
jgi:hypothetical protein